jgi:hypothetical protein
MATWHMRSASPWGYTPQYITEKGKLAARRGRKATSLFEAVGLPKGVAKKLQLRRTEKEAAVAMRCACGHSIFCRLERKGARLGLLAFFDDEPSSPTCGERVEQCPGCGKRLVIHTLFLPKTP